MLGTRTYDYTKEHKELDHDDTKVWCTHCKKVVEERDEIPDYGMFMGAVWVKQNLPCKPYEVDGDGSATPTTERTQDMSGTSS